METELKTLEQYLNDIGVLSGDNSGFTIIVGHTEMAISRRYLECEPMKRYLQKKVLSVYIRDGLWGEEAVFVLEEDKDG